jgi:hypothetical protein
VPAALVVVDLALLAFWLRIVRASWVEEAAWTYARRLIETAALPDPEPRGS